MNELAHRLITELRRSKRKGHWLLATSLLGLIAVAAADHYWLQNAGLLDKGAPNFSTAHLLRSLALATLAALTVLGLLHLFPKNETEKRPQIGVRRTHAMLILSAGLGVLFSASPSLFSLLSLEDHLVETASFWALIAAALLAASSAVLTWNGTRSSDHATSILIGLIALIFLVIGMEEASWLQREIGYETPTAITSHNMQGEFNLHNVHTHAAEVLYYTGAGLALVVIPFLLWAHPHLRPALRLGHALPHSYLIAIGALLSAFTCTMWNMLPIQFSFWLAQAVVLTVILRSEDPRERRHMSMVLAVAIALQLQFLWGHDHFIRSWEITEYKEMLIALGLLFYTLDVFISAHKTSWRPISATE